MGCVEGRQANYFLVHLNNQILTNSHRSQNITFKVIILNFNSIEYKLTKYKDQRSR